METPDKVAPKHESVGQKCVECNYWHDKNCGRCCIETNQVHRDGGMPACMRSFVPKIA